MPTVLAKTKGQQLDLSAPLLQVRFARGQYLFGSVCMVPCVECAHFCLQWCLGQVIGMLPEKWVAAACALCSRIACLNSHMSPDA